MIHHQLKYYETIKVNEHNQEFIDNVINIWGAEGRKWLNKMPATLSSLSKIWQLTKIQPIDCMSYNYVAYALQNEVKPVVLKVSCDDSVYASEYNALVHFNAHGSIRLYANNDTYQALLLERAIPGITLKSYHNRDIESAMILYANIVVKINSIPLKNVLNYTHVKTWCKAIDRVADSRIDKKYVNKAKELSNYLLSTAENEYLCHGDLHLENIIQHNNDWVAIDPKGIIGEKAFEVAAFDLLRENEIDDTNNIRNILKERIQLLAKITGVDCNRLSSWIFLRCMISAQWFIEDKGDPVKMLILIRQMYKIYF